MIESSSNAVALKNYIAFFMFFDFILYQIFKGNLVTCIFSAYKCGLNSFISVRIIFFIYDHNLPFFTVFNFLCMYRLGNGWRR